MKRRFSLLLILCLMLPVSAMAAEENLPRLQFPANNYVGYMNYDFYLQMEVKSSGNISYAKTMEVRDEDGRVWASKDFRPWSTSFAFKIPLDESHLGGHDLSIWCGDKQVSINTAYVAVTDRHKKAVQTVTTTEPYMSLSFDCAYVDKPTDELLALLDELDIKATFFMTGEFDVTVSAPARAEGMEVCMWSIDSHDWDAKYSQEQVLRRVTKNVGPGTIILFHLDGYYTPEVVRDAVPYYRDTLGLEFVPITELMAMGGMELPPSPYEE